MKVSLRRRRVLEKPRHTHRRCTFHYCVCTHRFSALTHCFRPRCGNLTQQMARYVSLAFKETICRSLWLLVLAPCTVCDLMGPTTKDGFNLWHCSSVCFVTRTLKSSAFNHHFKKKSFALKWSSTNLFFYTLNFLYAYHIYIYIYSFRICHAILPALNVSPLGLLYFFFYLFFGQMCLPATTKDRDLTAPPQQYKWYYPILWKRIALGTNVVYFHN